jgi:hypothetical protein
MSDEQGEQGIDGALRLRRMNESVRSRIDEFRGGPPPRYVVMCECLVPSCSEMLEIPRDEYRTVRSDARHFIVSGDHVDRERASVIRAFEGVAVVR